MSKSEIQKQNKLRFYLVLGLISMIFEPCHANEKKMKKYEKPSPDQIKKMLTSEQFSVTQKGATEAPFKNLYWNHHEAGIYVDTVTGEPLFSSTDKFDSGTGWPSFTQTIDKTSLTEKTDHSSFLGERTEVRSKQGDSHLGHVFNDGPSDRGGLRYCINSASLRFVPVQKLKEQGYEQYLPLFAEKDSSHSSSHSLPQALSHALSRYTPRGLTRTRHAPAQTPPTEIASFAAGCFWGVEQEFRKQKGVIATAAGFMGGQKENPTYEEVCAKNTGHAETVQVEYDPKVISYPELLDLFWHLHNPTTLNRQGPDVGDQYRSAVFFHSPQQQAQAMKSLEQLQNSGEFSEKIVTQITPAAAFYPAEEYHQHYVEKGGHAACHIRRPKKK